MWWRTPKPARGYTAGLVLSAVAATVVATVDASLRDFAVLAVLLGAGMLNVELGRLAEGGRFDGQRIHKGLSAWPFAAALLLPPGLAGWVAASVYAHAWLRGIRITRWKWIGSCAIVVIASLGASGVLSLVAGGPLVRAGSAVAFSGVVGALAAFVGIEALLFVVISRLNTSSDEVYLRAQLASVSFYAIEAAVLGSGAVAAVLFRYSPGFLLFAVPAYLLMQRGMLHQPLKDEARHDAKTGVLNWEAWRLAASAALTQAARDGEVVAVIIVDIDPFKSVNDTFGHLVGDEVLSLTAEAVASCVRRNDLVGRFGGDEFCALLSSASLADAAAAAERMRASVAGLRLAASDVRVTASVGVAVSGGSVSGGSVSGGSAGSMDVPSLVAAADRALYQAKAAGRDRVASLAAGAGDAASETVARLPSSPPRP